MNLLWDARPRSSLFGWSPDKLRTTRINRLSSSSEQESRKMPAGAAMKIIVNNKVHLSEFRSSDKPALIQHLNDRDIYDRTLRIPFPYTEKDADHWLALVAKIAEQQGRPVHFAIRSADDA